MPPIVQLSPYLERYAVDRALGRDEWEVFWDYKCSVEALGEIAADTPLGLAGGNHGAPRSEEIMAALEKLAELHKKGVVSDAEFQAKKAELLGRQ